jgi:hypothetical protein
VRGLWDKVFGVLGLVSAWNDKAGPILTDCTGTTTQIHIDVLEQAMPYYASQTTSARDGFKISLGGILGTKSGRLTDQEY